MTRKKREESYKPKLFNLSLEVINLLEKHAEFEEMNKTEFIEFMIKNWDKNPADKLIELTKEKEILQEEINQIDIKIKQAMNYNKLMSEFSNQKNIKKSEAIKIIQKSLLNEDYIKAESLGKVWQKILGIPYIELIMDAKLQLEKKGI